MARRLGCAAWPLWPGRCGAWAIRRRRSSAVRRRWPWPRRSPIPIIWRGPRSGRLTCITAVATPPRCRRRPRPSCRWRAPRGGRSWWELRPAIGAGPWPCRARARWAWPCSARGWPPSPTPRIRSRARALADPPGRADAAGRGGQGEPVLGPLAEAKTLLEPHEQGDLLAEAYRLQGEWALRQPRPDAAQAEACLQQALAIARQQHAKSWELRAAVSLS